MLFGWLLKNKVTEGERIDLVLESHRNPSFHNNYVPSDLYGIFLHGSSARIGECDIRIGMNEELYYAGNIGYRIYEPYRGHGYAYDAAKMLMKIARDEHDFKEIILTCSPDNTASKKTLEKLGGELVETVDVPAWHWLYKRGEKVKHIYRYDLINTNIL